MYLILFAWNSKHITHITGQCLIILKILHLHYFSFINSKHIFTQDRELFWKTLSESQWHFFHNVFFLPSHLKQNWPVRTHWFTRVHKLIGCASDVLVLFSFRTRKQSDCKKEEVTIFRWTNLSELIQPVKDTALIKLLTNVVWDINQVLQ